MKVNTMIDTTSYVNEDYDREKHTERRDDYVHYGNIPSVESMAPILCDRCHEPSEHFIMSNGIMTCDDCMDYLRTKW